MTQQQWTMFYENIVTPMTKYQIPVIQIGNDVPKEAVCQVFENVNQGGVSLTVFELVTATLAADNFASHQIDVAAIRSDDFYTYFDKRKKALLDLIEKATGKTVSGRDEVQLEAVGEDAVEKLF